MRARRSSAWRSCSSRTTGILNREAEALLWVSLDESHALDLAIDRVAVGEYIRVQQNQHD